ncbi:putative auxin efflux carrier component 8 [Phtheirospermum japonicum]|uniref:Auxin efflux carrier component n=1 Tax=Phtheirospermum japonicum TaxID=374723 RepID=A0A830CZH9_9LAMI|nr:putative auxin efflux carrier component 8 [Phtheirospermum japonicum]
MIAWEDINKVVMSMAPLYVPLGLGYASVKRWRMFKPDQCDAINRFNCYFIIPFFTFHFTSGVDPYRMNFRFLAGDVVAKAIAGVSLALWANLWRSGNFSWAITSFSLWSLNNTLVVGVPLLQAMYGPVGEDLVVQSSVIQALLWFPTLLFMLELRRSIPDNSKNEIDHVENKNSTTSEADSTTAESTVTYSSRYNGVGSIMMKVGVKLARNPNCYACIVGLIWALISKRWNFEMPSIVEGSVMIMAKAGSGVAMFSMGLFMALQNKVIACGVRLSLYGMLLRFVGGPVTTAIGALALGLKSNTFRIAIVQAALPEAVTAFVFAQEYGLHADVLSTAVIFGTIVSLPLLIGYYAILDVLHL